MPSVQRRRVELLDQIEEVFTGKVRWIVTTYPAAEGEELADHLQQLQSDPMLQGILGGVVYDSAGTWVAAFGESLELTAAAETPPQKPGFSPSLPVMPLKQRRNRVSGPGFSFP